MATKTNHATHQKKKYTAFSIIKNALEHLTRSTLTTLFNALFAFYALTSLLATRNEFISGDYFGVFGGFLVFAITTGTIIYLNTILSPTDD